MANLDLADLVARVEDDDESNIDALRADIANRIAEAVETLREEMGDWERTNLAFAIGCLLQNIRSGRGSKSWLRPCLLALHKTFTPAQERGDDGAAQGPSYDELRAAIQALGGHTP
jgi:hypothetical protein